MTSPTTEPEFLDKVLVVAEEAALLAGQVIRKASTTKQLQAQRLATFKSSNTDLVTETDKKCEDIIRQYIQQQFPNHKIIGEEESSSSNDDNERYKLTSDPTWTIDPIDGTTNFVHGLNLSCVLLAYLVDKEVYVGVVYDPYAEELFWAIQGRGAFLKTTTNTEDNDDETNNTTSSSSRPISVSQTESLPQAVISMDPGYGRDEVAVQRFCSVQSVILSRRVRNIRVFGCTGLNMAYVACGRLDAGFEEGSWETNRGPKIWDFAAGRLLVEEAGGITWDLENKSKHNNDEDEGDVPLDLMKRSFFCASNPKLAKEILEAIYEGQSSYDNNKYQTS